MHFAPASSRALLAASLSALAVGASAQAPVAPLPKLPPAKASDGVLLDAAKGAIGGAVLAKARADLADGDAVFLVAVQGRGNLVSFLLLVFGTNDAGGYAVVGRDDVRTGPLPGPPAVGLDANAHPFAPGALTATVGWRAVDGSSEAQTLLFVRRGGGRIAQLLALEPVRTFPAGGGRATARQEVEVLPTSSGGFKDLRVRSRECSPGGECGDPYEVASYIFDGVRYAVRPHAIPFLERIEASSVLASSGALFDYSGAAAVDGRADTAWCEGAKGAGWFERLELTFSPAAKVKALLLLPGGGKGDPFVDWTRPKRIRVILPDGRKVDADLADEPRVQRVALPEGDRVFGMTVVITDVYKGKREDACIAELDLEVEP